MDYTSDTHADKTVNNRQTASTLGEINEEDYFRQSKSITNEPIFKPSSDKVNEKIFEPKKAIPFPTKNEYKKNEFEILGLLGRGAYAKVVKAKLKKDGSIYAIKIIDKSFIEKVN
jgi:hypothetical protein